MLMGRYATLYDHLKQLIEGSIIYLCLFSCIGWLSDQGLREAIKNGDTAAVKKLLSEVKSLFFISNFVD